MQPETKIIFTTRELKGVIHKIDSKSKVALQLPCLTDSENDSWTEKLQNYGDNCGCDAGGLGGMVGVTCCLIFGTLNYSAVFEQPRYYGASGFILVFLSCLLAKSASFTIQSYRRHQDYKAICLLSEKHRSDTLR